MATTNASTPDLHARARAALAAVRAPWPRKRIDALVMQSNNDWMGGYVKWFTDVPIGPWPIPS